MHKRVTKILALSRLFQKRSRMRVEAGDKRVRDEVLRPGHSWANLGFVIACVHRFGKSTVQRLTRICQAATNTISESTIIIPFAKVHNVVTSAAESHNVVRVAGGGALHNIILVIIVQR